MSNNVVTKPSPPQPADGRAARESRLKLVSFTPQAAVFLACRPPVGELISFVSVSLDGRRVGGLIPWRLKTKSSNPVISFYNVLVKMGSMPR